MSYQWETFCDVGYYHMWRLRRENERGWNDGFHINTRAEAEGLCELLNKLERERDEALSDLEFRRDLFKLQEQQLNDVRAERDEARETAERYRLEANAMMMQRDEARADLVYEQGGIHATAGGWAAKYAEAIEQRDRLAEALKDVEEWPFIENAIDKIIQEIEKLEEKL